MITLNLEIKNPDPILRELSPLFSSRNPGKYVYLNLPSDNNFGNPLNLTSHQNAMGITEQILPEILQTLGIRSIMLIEPHDLSNLIHLGELLQKTDFNGLDYLNYEPLVNELKKLFKIARTVAFDDWSDFGAAPTLWAELMREILIPSGGYHIEFIFYFGDPGTKLSTQVDEALAIISDFSKVGKVTLALDESEIFHLWRALNGIRTEVMLPAQTIGDLNRKYLSIFNAIAVSRLLIYSTSNAVLLSSDEQFMLSRKVAETRVELGMNARQNFIAGYSAGLAMGNSIPNCIALGLIIFGASGLYSRLPAVDQVQKFIKAWMEDLDKPESMFLYQ